MSVNIRIYFRPPGIIYWDVLRTLECGYNLWIPVKHNKLHHDSGSMSPTSAWFQPRAGPFTSPYWLTTHSHIGADFWNVNTGVCASLLPGDLLQVLRSELYSGQSLLTILLAGTRKTTDCWRQITGLIKLIAKTPLCCVKTDKNQRQPCTSHKHQGTMLSFLLSHGMKRALDRELHWPVLVRQQIFQIWARPACD